MASPITPSSCGPEDGQAFHSNGGDAGTEARTSPQPPSMVAPGGIIQPTDPGSFLEASPIINMLSNINKQAMCPVLRHEQCVCLELDR